jgi:outer membrane protein assembly factor BamB
VAAAPSWPCFGHWRNLDEVLFFGSNMNSTVYAFNPLGSLLWTFNTSAPVMGSLAMNSEGALVVFTSQSVFTLVK